MDEQLKHLLILLGGIAAVLILIIILFSRKSFFMKFMSIFLEDTSVEQEKPSPRSRNGAPNGNQNFYSENMNTSQRRSGGDVQKKTSEPIVEMATLIRKSDDRLRVIESTGQQKLIDEYYELVFVTRKGKTLKIECSRDAYERVPFNQQGSLTYKRNTLVKFKYYEDVVYNN